LGRGGMGVVYVALHPELGRKVALKLLLAGEAAGERARQRFAQEARAAARLRHPHIVGIHDVGQDRLGPCLVMDLVEGESLATRLERAGPFEPRQAAELVRKLAQAISYAHEQAILHRDIKPDNVLITPRGEPVLTDFGLAKEVGGGSDQPLTLSGQLVGTPSYMSPEQAAGKPDQIDRRSDVYALGVTLYQLLTGEVPFESESLISLLAEITQREPTPPSRLQPAVDPDLDTIVLHCLEKEPAARYPSASALAEDLARFLADQPIVARPTTAADRARKWLRRNRAVALALALSSAVAGALLVAGALAFAFRLGRERDRALEAKAAAEDALERLARQKELAEQERRKAERLRVEALAQREEALAQRREAQTQRKQADVQRLRAEELLTTAISDRARLAMNEGNWRDAAALAAHANLLGPNLARSITCQRALEHVWEQVRLGQGPAAFGPKGTLVASADGPTLSLRDGRTGQINQLLGRMTEDVAHLAWGSQALAAVDKAGNLRVLFPAGSQRKPVQLRVPSRPSSLSWSPDGSRLALVLEGGALVLDLARPRRPLTKRGSFRSGRAVWSPDGSLVTLHAPGAKGGAWTSLFWPTDGSPPRALPTSGNLAGFSHDGRRLALLTQRSRGQLYEVSPAGELRPLASLLDTCQGLQLAWSGQAPRRLAIADTQRFLVLDEERGQVVSGQRCQEGLVLSLGWSTSGSYLYGAGAFGADLFRWRPQGIELVESWTLGMDAKQDRRGLLAFLESSWSPDSSEELMARTRSDQVFLTRGARGVDVATIPRRMVQGVAWSASGERVLIHNLTPGGGRAGGPAMIESWLCGPPGFSKGPVRRGRRVELLGSVRALAWDPGGRGVAALVETPERTMLARIPLLEGTPSTGRALNAGEPRWLEWSPRGPLAALVGETLHVMTGGIAGRHPARTLVQAAAWSGSGSLLAFASEGRLQVLATAGGERGWPLPAEALPQRGLAWQGDQEVAVIGASAVHVLQLATGSWRRIATPQREPSTLSWSPRGGLLALQVPGPSSAELLVFRAGKQVYRAQLPRLFSSRPRYAFGPEGQLAHSGGAGGLSVWRDGRSTRAGKTEVLWALRYSAQGRLAALGRQLQVYDDPQGAPLAELGAAGRDARFRWAPEGEWLAIAEGNEVRLAHVPSAPGDPEQLAALARERTGVEVEGLVVKTVR
ncbi:MAG TPA: hypothetical protein DEA08_00550, partial [Planctomycetes bacterium]|nr:hypothetical protein [Planctomycetota bacterium]